MTTPSELTFSGSEEWRETTTWLIQHLEVLSEAYNDDEEEDAAEIAMTFCEKWPEIKASLKYALNALPGATTEGS